MSEKKIWLSETKLEMATTAIIIGSIDSNILNECRSIYKSGLLFVSSNDNIEDDPSSKFHTLNLNLNREVILSSLSDFFLNDTTNPPEVKVSALIKKEETFLYEKFIHLVFNEIDTLLRARKTRKETGFLRQLQIFSNLDGYLLHRIPEDWHGLGEKNLAVVVGAGPSLDISLPLIKKGLPSPIIIATDSSLKALAKEEIIPDFVISIDPEKSFEECSECNFTPGIVILSSQSHTSWSENWQKKCFISGRVIFEDWLSEKGIGKSSVLAINNAGLTALAFADFLSPSAILLIGMDLSGGGDGRVRYAQSTGRSNIEIDTSYFHDIPGNYNKSVPTPFFSDWQETSQACADLSKKRSIINLNDRGAILQGTNLVHPDDFVEVKKLLCENLSYFKGTNEEVWGKRRKIPGLGLSQILTVMTRICDQTRQTLEQAPVGCNSSSVLKEILADSTTASLLGDFAFSIMPMLTSGKVEQSFEIEREQLKVLLWKLEDGILKCNPGEEFILRFLNEKFC